MKRKKITVATLLVILVIAGVAVLTPTKTKQAINSAEKQSTENVFKDFKVSSRTYPVVYDLMQSASLQVVVNKKHALPASYVPDVTAWSTVVLRNEALDGYKKMLESAKNDGIILRGISSYRSYQEQEKLFNDYVKKDGQVKAEAYSARPGHSEHQTGLAVDIGLPSGACDLETCMANTKEGKWLAANSHEFGFIIRYPENKIEATGYQYEPWHLRYVGVEVASVIYESGYTLDEFYGFTAGGYAIQATTNL